MSRTASPMSLALLAFVVGCANLSPHYQRPPPAVPAEGRPASDRGSELSWRVVYVDERLRRLIELSLANNRDLRVAALSVERARAQYRVQKSLNLPSVSLVASAERSENVGNQYSASVGLVAFELDFFGRIRNLSEAALQSFLQLDESRRSVQISLVSEVANAWLTLAADLQRQRLADRTFRSRLQSVELTQTRHRLGAVGGLQLAQAQTALESARADSAGYAAQIGQDRNALELLVGAGVPVELLPLADASGVPELAVLPAPPAGVPSSVLQQRPDVLAAEHALRAAHADIGAARAAMFPVITLTGSVGGVSTELSKLFQRGAWSFGPALSLPIFDGGASRASARAAEVGRDIALAQYDKSVQSAFREVADALAVSATLVERIAAQRALYDTTQRQVNLAEVSYQTGGSSQLELLDAQRSLYAAEQGLITLLQIAQSNRITLYKVLGGGWNGA